MTGYTVTGPDALLGLAPGARATASWKPSVPISSVRTWPVMKMTGVESIIASAIAVTRLVAPGPEVAKATPTRPEAFAYPSAA